MYAEPVDAVRRDGMSRNDTMMAGFYIQHNTSIGLRCFAWGILFGLGSLYQLFYNAMFFGTLCWLHGDQAARRRTFSRS